MAKLRRTLLVGLGGTGFKAILNAKKMFYENYDEIPPMIGFLGIDTDRPGLENASVTAKDGTKISLNKSEQLAITVDEPREVYERNLTNKLFDWLPEANVSGLSTLTIGAGQMRSNGRFAITVNEHNAKQFINQKLTEVTNANTRDNSKYEVLGNEPEVHMVFSLGGGTGSGTFLNVAYLIKRLMPTVKLSGYAVLPDVFRTMVSGAMSSRVRPNGKGAIIDLDYLAHLNSLSEPVEIKWFQAPQMVKERPFNALYLIDNKNENNDVFPTVDPLCDMISLAIVTSVGELGVTLDSIADNVNKLISDGSMDVKNKKAWVASFGCAEILFDGDRLSRIYAAKAGVQLVNMMLNGGCDDPAIIANTWFDNTKIRENLGKDDVIDYFMAPTPHYPFSEIDNPDNPEPDAMRYINTVGLEKQADLDQKLADLEKRVDESLTRLMSEQANRECGVFLCNSILQNILTQIHLCDGEMKDEIKQLEESKPMLESGLKTACVELKKCMETFFRRGKNDYMDEVMAKTTALATREREISRRKMARQFYSWLQVRVGQSIQRVDIIMQNLEAVRKSFNEQIQQLLREGSGHSFFQFDLAAEQAETISCPLSDIVFNNFVTDMKENGGINAISGMTSKQTEEAILHFVDTMPKVKELRNKTIDNILDGLSEETLRDLMRRAIQKSLPLLSYTYRGFDADLRERPVESYYIGVSNKHSSRLVKDNLFQSLVSGAKDVQFSEIGLNNRIIIYRQLGVIPAFAVRSLDNYRTEYEKWETDKPLGSHWDKNLCNRMTKERYDLMPRNEVNKARLLELWTKAIIYDLISFDPQAGKYRIKSRGMGGNPLRGWLVDMGSTRVEAFTYLEDNADILEPEIKKAIDELDIPGPNNIIKKNSAEAFRACDRGTYLEEFSKCPIPADQIETYPAEMQLIMDEINFITDHLQPR